MRGAHRKPASFHALRGPGRPDHPGPSGFSSVPKPMEKSGEDDPYYVRIYLLPNLLTAANLACGFFAMTFVLRYKEGGLFEPIRIALRFILGAFVFDFLDGLLARVSGRTSRFGVEFDSLADMVSFGVVPALLVYRIVLHEFHRAGVLIAAAYLVCGGIRLARFNVISQRDSAGTTKREFVGIPIPAAAGLVVSVSLYMMSPPVQEKVFGPWRFILPPMMLLLAFLMVSNVRFPAFKHIEWTPVRSASAFSGAVVVALLLLLDLHATLALLFLSYVVYGLARHWVRVVRSAGRGRRAEGA